MKHSSTLTSLGLPSCFLQITALGLSLTAMSCAQAPTTFHDDYLDEEATLSFSSSPVPQSQDLDSTPLSPFLEEGPSDGSQLAAGLAEQEMAAAPSSLAPERKKYRSRKPGKPEKREAQHHDRSWNHPQTRLQESHFLRVSEKALSTFSIDVDTASFSHARRFIESGVEAPPEAVRIEEMINYFSYAYEEPRGDVPFSVTSEVSDCPWNPEARLVHIGIQGKKIKNHAIPARNLVFLLDVSGSMNSEDKLPLLKQAMMMLASRLRAQDHISIVVYAGASGVILEPTHSEAAVQAALDRLSAGGSTNGGEGIQRAYALAQRHFVAGGINRVILATDGDFNVGLTSQRALKNLIKKQRDHGVFLTVLGFGHDNFKDSTMEILADHGNGNYAYIDSLKEARKVLVEEASSTLVTIAKDVKIQVEMNPEQVSSYRLVGYENRALEDRDFNNDQKDAGEIGAGHSVTALYEVIPRKSPHEHTPHARRHTPRSNELLHVKLRYKTLSSSSSQLLQFPVTDHGTPLHRSSNDFRFSAAVTEYAMVLGNSQFKGHASLSHARELAQAALGHDRNRHRRDFIALIGLAERIYGDSREFDPHYRYSHHRQ